MMSPFLVLVRSWNDDKKIKKKDKPLRNFILGYFDLRFSSLLPIDDSVICRETVELHARLDLRRNTEKPLATDLKSSDILAIHRMMEQHQMQAHKERERRTSGSGEA